MKTNERALNLEIALLRSFAVLVVLGFHFFPSYFPLGFLGVDIFFVISGYLMVPLIYRSHSISYFLWNRVKRLYPPLIFCLFIFIIIGYISLLDDEFNILLRSSFWSILQGQNFIEFSRSGYFVDSGGFRPFLNIWSLSVEFQSYVFLVLLYFWFLKLHTPSNKSYNVLYISIIFLSAYFIFEFFSDPFFITPLRLWEFLFGCLAYHLSVELKFFSKRKNKLAYFIGFLLPSISLLYYIDDKEILTFIAVLTTAAFICCVDVSEFKINRVGTRAYLYIGAISYSVYLMHYPALEFLKIYTGSPNVLERFSLLVIVFLISHIMDRCIQPWFTHIKNNNQLILVSSFSFVILAASCLLVFSGHRWVEVKNAELVSNSEFKMDYNHECGFPREKYKDERCRISEKLVDKSDPKFVLIGDSLSNSLTTMFDTLGKDEVKYVQYIQYGKGSCPIVLKTESVECQQFSHRVLADIEKYGGNSVLVVMAQWSLYPEKSLYSLEEFLRRSRASNKKVIVSLSFPLGARPRTCIDRGIPSLSGNQHCDTPLNVSIERSQKAHEVIRGLVHKYGYELFDPSGFFCDLKYCKVVDKNTLLYFDDSHITRAGGAYLAAKSKGWLDENAL